MEQKDILDALVQAKRMGNLLHEVMDLSNQLAEALDRGDQVSVRMVMAMRREPIDKLQGVKQALRDQKTSLASAQDAQRLEQLLNGAPAQREEEKLLADQVAANKRMLERVLELDRRLNQKIAREKSIYNSER